MNKITPKIYTSLDATGIPASGVGKASVEEIREEKAADSRSKAQARSDGWSVQKRHEEIAD